MLRLERVDKRFAQTGFALQAFSCTLGNGLHVLAGPNGAGKSTLMRILAGVIEPDAGAFTLHGRDVFADWAGYKRVLGYLPQTLGFYDHMTGTDFLQYMANLKGFFSRDAQERVEYAAGLTGIRELCRQKIKAWSTGARQRLGMAQALLGDPELLVLDEPFCGLGPEEQEKMEELLHHLARERIVLISTHLLQGFDMDRLLLLVNGKLEFNGSPVVFREEARGRVWALAAGKEQWLELQSRYPENAVLFDGERCRMVGLQRPENPDGEALEPGLEEAYLFWMQRLRRREGGLQ